MPPAFLMQQMEWRETLEEASGLAELEGLVEQVDQARRDTLRTLDLMIDQERDFVKAVGQVRALMFIERFCDEVNVRLDACLDGMDTASKGQ